jgi:nucleoside-diphosphate-sugar epimerase
MASLLIIGGSGFFGKSFLDANKRGLLGKFDIKKVIIYSRNAKGLIVSNPELVDCDEVDLVNGDITVCNAIPHADYIIHAAASTDIAKYIAMPEKERGNIIAGTRNLCKIIKEGGYKAKILYVSSGAIYGKQPQDILEIPETYSIEDQSLDSMDEAKAHYAFAKRESERLILELGSHGFNVSIARCFAFVGKYLPRDQHFAIGNFIEDGIRGRPVTVKARAPIYRSYMYADDLVDWIFGSLRLATPACLTLNVGSNESTSVAKLAEIIARECGVLADAKVDETLEADRYIPSIEKALALGLKINYDLRSSITRTINAI